jgi:hypothetical protein
MIRHFVIIGGLAALAMTCVGSLASARSASMQALVTEGRALGQSERILREEAVEGDYVYAALPRLAPLPRTAMGR